MAELVSIPVPVQDYSEQNQDPTDQPAGTAFQFPNRFRITRTRELNGCGPAGLPSFNSRTGSGLLERRILDRAGGRHVGAVSIPEPVQDYSEQYAIITKKRGECVAFQFPNRFRITRTYIITVQILNKNGGFNSRTGSGLLGHWQSASQSAP